MTEPHARDYYEVLGIPPEATARDIRRAYRALALRYHPDVCAGGDTGRRFREISDAYGVLHDPAQRERYDRSAGHRRAGPMRVRTTSFAAAARGRRVRDVPRFLDDEPARWDRDVPRFLDDEPAGWRVVIEVRDWRWPWR